MGETKHTPNVQKITYVSSKHTFGYKIIKWGHTTPPMPVSVVILWFKSIHQVIPQSIIIERSGQTAKCPWYTSAHSAPVFPNTQWFQGKQRIANVRDENRKFVYLFWGGMHWEWKIDTRGIYCENLVNVLELYVWVSCQCLHNERPWWKYFGFFFITCWIARYFLFWHMEELLMN